MICKRCNQSWPDHLVHAFFSNKVPTQMVDPICGLALMREIHGDPTYEFSGDMNRANYAEARQIAATIEKAKAEDPKELRAKIHQLEADNRKLQTSFRPPPVTEVELVQVKVPVLKKGELTRLTRVAHKLFQHSNAVRESINVLGQGLKLFDRITGRMQDLLRQEQKNVISQALPEIAEGLNCMPGEMRIAKAEPMKFITRTAPAGTHWKDAVPCGLPAGERKILAAIAQYPRGMTREQLSILTGYKRSSRDTYLQKLLAAGQADRSGDLIRITEAGRATLGTDFEPLPTGHNLRAYWLQRLPEGERKILQVILEAYPQAIAREAIDEQTGYKRSSRDTYLQKLKARELIVAARIEVRARGELFE
jgi:hypothetical protein